jgi:peptidoglycan/xylan/chitin deacetylase (PgdA/CDA1 family)
MKGDKLKPVHERWLQELAPGVDVKTIAQRMYLSEKQIWLHNSPLIEIGMHGHEHPNVSQITEIQFEKDVNQCEEILKTHPRYIPAYAYPWGKTTKDSMAYLLHNGIIPVVVRGGKNYSWSGFVDRECIDNIEIGEYETVKTLHKSIKTKNYTFDSE